MNFAHFVDPAFEQFMLSLYLFIQAHRDLSLLKTPIYQRII